MILTGVDEVGIGPLAGPMVAAAVTMRVPNFSPKDPGAWWPLHSVVDSKRLKKATKRAKVEQEIVSFLLEEGAELGISVVWPARINDRGHKDCYAHLLRRAVLNATRRFDIEPRLVAVDGNLTIPGLPYRQTPYVKGDTRVFLIASASIVARVVRDEIMVDMHEDYPEYGFDSHSGYGTEKHLEAMHRHGLCPAHRERASTTALKNWRKKNL